MPETTQFEGQSCNLGGPLLLTHSLSKETASPYPGPLFPQINEITTMLWLKQRGAGLINPSLWRRQRNTESTLAWVRSPDQMLKGDCTDIILLSEPQFP